MDWQLCLKPASVSPQDLCELNVNAVLLCDVMQKHRKNGWMVAKIRKNKGEGKQGGGRKMERETHDNTMRDYICSP